MNKYALIDLEIHRHDRDTDSFVPLTVAEAQHVVDTMNQVESTPALQKLLREFREIDESYSPIIDLVAD